MITINANDMVSIVTAAKIWFKKQNEICEEIKSPYKFEHELEIVTNLKKQIDSTIWDADAELFIDEIPF